MSPDIHNSPDVSTSDISLEFHTVSMPYSEARELGVLKDRDLVRDTDLEPLIVRLHGGAKDPDRLLLDYPLPNGETVQEFAFRVVRNSIIRKRRSAVRQRAKSLSAIPSVRESLSIRDGVSIGVSIPCTTATDTTVSCASVLEAPCSSVIGNDDERNSRSERTVPFDVPHSEGYDVSALSERATRGGMDIVQDSRVVRENQRTGAVCGARALCDVVGATAGIPPSLYNIASDREIVSGPFKWFPEITVAVSALPPFMCRHSCWIDRLIVGHTFGSSRCAPVGSLQTGVDQDPPMPYTYVTNDTQRIITIIILPLVVRSETLRACDAASAIVGAQAVVMMPCDNVVFNDVKNTEGSHDDVDTGLEWFRLIQRCADSGELSSSLPSRIEPPQPAHPGACRFVDGAWVCRDDVSD